MHPPQHSIGAIVAGHHVFHGVVSELEGQLRHAAPHLVILSVMQSNEASATALKVLLELVPTVPVIVLSAVDDVDLALNRPPPWREGIYPCDDGI